MYITATSARDEYAGQRVVIPVSRIIKATEHLTREGVTVVWLESGDDRPFMEYLEMDFQRFAEALSGTG